MSFLSGFIESTIFPQRRMGAFNIDLTLDEVIEDKKVVTENPVDRGANINDHFYLESPEVSINFVVGQKDAPTQTTYLTIIELFKSNIPFDLVTKNRAFSNMYIHTLLTRNDANTNTVLSVSLTLRQYNFATLEVVGVPERSKQASPDQTGSTEKVGTKKAKVVDPNDSGVTNKVNSSNLLDLRNSLFGSPDPLTERRP